MTNLDWYLESYSNDPWAYCDTAFTKEECDTIINLFKDSVNKGRVVGPEEAQATRDSNVFFIEPGDKKNQWIFQRLTSIIIKMNEQFFNFDIDRIESVQFSEYDASYNGFYKSHIDMVYGQSSTFRKLSFSVQLTESDDYSGGDLKLHTSHNPGTAERTKGTLSIFPSYLLHEVTPVMDGTRYALVGWVLGNRFK